MYMCVYIYSIYHTDLYTINASIQGKPVNSIFVTPAVTPIKSQWEPFSNNPGLRAYLYHPENYGLLVSLHLLASSSTDLFTFSMPLELLEHTYNY